MSDKNKNELALPDGKGAFLAKPADLGKIKLKRLSLPPVIKARDILLNASVAGKLLAVAEPRQDKKSKIKNGSRLLTLETLDGKPFRIAETAVIKRALDTMGGANALIGHVIVLTAKGKGVAKPGQNAPYLFDVDVSETKL